MLSAKQMFERRKQRVRTKIRAVSSGRIRLSVFRSQKHIYAQFIDDQSGVTLAAASSLDKDMRKKLKTGATKDAAVAVGELAAARALKKDIKVVVYDKGGYQYHGRIAALADAVRAAGISF
jgi:large subunit ribosomal protein L18